MALQFRQFRHKETGQIWHTPAGRYGNFLNSIKKLVNFVHYNMERYYVVHLILTVAENTGELGYENLHRVITFVGTRLKRKDAVFKYVAVKERQERGAIHYHVLCLYNKPYVFPTSEEIAKSWGLGFVKLRAPKIRVRLWKIVNYIGKYIGKGYEYGALDVKKSFTASQIRQIYKLRPKRLSEVVRRFGKGMAEQFVCTYGKVFIVGYELSSILGIEVKKPFRDLIMEFPSEWAYKGICAEPF
jgi:hypothetical protein